MQNNILVSVESINEKLLSDLSEQKVGVELSYFAYPWNLDKANFKEEIQRHKDLLQGFLLPKSMHGAFYDLNPNIIIEVKTKESYLTSLAALRSK